MHARLGSGLGTGAPGRQSMLYSNGNAHLGYVTSCKTKKMLLLAMQCSKNMNDGNKTCKSNGIDCQSHWVENNWWYLNQEPSECFLHHWSSPLQDFCDGHSEKHVIFSFVFLAVQWQCSVLQRIWHTYFVYSSFNPCSWKYWDKKVYKDCIVLRPLR